MKKQAIITTSGLLPNGSLRQANLKLLFEKAKQYETASFKGLFNFLNFMDQVKSHNSDMDSAKLIGENENVIRIMSIHKSKGLEFPVVFLCGTGKKFNLQDLNEPILLHQDLGIGLQYRDEERRIEYSTLAKEALRSQAKLETMAEEMRILYVALTRAKEKCIITGIGKGIHKELEKKEELLKRVEQKKIPPVILKQYHSYLDWLQLIYVKEKQAIDGIIECKIHSKKEIIEEKKDEVKENVLFEKEKKEEINKEEFQKIQEILNWKYPNLLACSMPSKTSVTKIKQIRQPIAFEEHKEPIYKMQQWEKPKFLQQEIKVSKAEQGTLVHFVIQHLNEKEVYTREKIKNLIETMVLKEQMTKEQAQAIPVSKIEKYIESSLWKELQQAKKVQKEQAFYTLLPAKEIYQEEIEEDILVQGVIDVYYINAQGELVLVDYKTDRVKQDKQELIEKYTQQLVLYQKALEEAFNRKVDKIYIYSTDLSQIIQIKETD